jgi:GntR family transcriptional regulator
MPLRGGLSGIDLDRQAPTPYWRQLYVQLSTLIESGSIGEGGNLPSERDFAEALGVSRSTVKHCYDELRRAKVLAGKGRAGSVVQAAAQVRPALGRLKSFTEEMRELGLTASARIEVCEVVRDRVIASLFGRPSNAPFLHLVRIRKGDDVPMSRERAWYDVTLVPALAQWNGQGSSYALLKDQCGVSLASAEQTVEAVISSPKETRAFGFDAPGPCLLFKRKAYADDGHLVEYVEGTFRGDAYVYRLKLET